MMWWGAAFISDFRLAFDPGISDAARLLDFSSMFYRANTLAGVTPFGCITLWIHWLSVSNVSKHGHISQNTTYFGIVS